MVMLLPYFIYLVFSVQSIEGEESCVPGWIRYHNSCYLFSREQMNWSEAERHCKVYGDGVKLAEVESVEEEGFLRILLVNKYSHVVGLQGFWLGATDDQQEGHWVWIKDRQLVAYSDWAPGEPNNRYGEENCLEFWAEQNFKWNDAPCRLKRHFICEEMLDF